MAGDWLKIEVSTPDKPEVFRMSAELGIDVDAVLGKCIRFWAWADANTEDGNVDAKTSTGVDALKLHIDRMCSHKGFSDSLISVGWLTISECGTQVVIPNFAHHNGDSAKKRAAKSKRQQRWREKKRAENSAENVDAKPSTRVDATAYPREEKRREDIKDSSLDDERVSKLPVSVKFCEQVIEQFIELCPELPSPRLVDEKRINAIRRITKLKIPGKDLTTIEFWQSLFEYIHKSDFLCGRSSDFKAGIDWIVTPSNFKKIIEGNYENRKQAG